jgi:Nodulation protein Z (NodZ)
MAPTQDRFVLCARLAGLGDMLQQAAKGLALARLMAAPLLVDWRRCFYADPATGANVFGQHIFHPEMQPVEAAAKLPLGPEAVRMLSTGNYPRQMSAQVYEALVRREAPLPEHWVVLCDSLGSRGHAHFPDLARFSFDETTHREADNFIGAHGLDEAIGVHYRHGNGEFSDIKSDAYITSEIRHVCEMIGNSERRESSRPVFVATDSSIAEAQFREFLGGFTVVALPKPFQPPGSGSLHYSALAANSSSQDVHLTLPPTLTEMLVLSRCARLYRDHHSSFTNWSTARMLHVHGCNASDIVEYPFRRRQARVLAAQSVLASARQAKRAG